MKRVVIFVLAFFVNSLCGYNFYDKLKQIEEQNALSRSFEEMRTIQAYHYEKPDAESIRAAQNLCQAANGYQTAANEYNRHLEAYFGGKEIPEIGYGDMLKRHVIYRSKPALDQAKKKFDRATADYQKTKNQ